MADGVESRHPKETKSRVNTWICSHTGVLPSQYTPHAIDQLIASITSTLETIESSSVCSHGTDAHSAFLEEITTICLPIMTIPKVLPIIERLISSQYHCSNLSHNFLDKVTALQSTEAGYFETPKLNLSNEARVKLWAIYLPSFRQELIDLVKAVSSMGLSQCEMDLVISARNVPKACLEHYHLLLYTEEVLRVLYVSAKASRRIKQLIASFNRQLLEAQKEKSCQHPIQCPQFNPDKWIPQSVQSEAEQ